MNQLRLDDRVAIVTGAGRGLGEAYAHALAERGAAVVVNDVDTGVGGVTLADSVAGEIRSRGGRAVGHTGDISDPAQIERLVGTAIESFGSLDIVIANAAIFGTGEPMETRIDDVERFMRINLHGTQMLCQAAWPHMMASGYGRMVIVSSAAILGSTRAIPYALSKGAVTALGRALAELADRADADVKVNMLAPHAFTRMQAGTYDNDPAAKRLREEQGSASRVAETVVVLAHELCPANGGLYASGGGRVKKVFFGETVGIAEPELSAEEMLLRWSEVEDPTGSAPIVGGTAEFSDRMYVRTPASD